MPLRSAVSATGGCARGAYSLWSAVCGVLPASPVQRWTFNVDCSMFAILPLSSGGPAASLACPSTETRENTSSFSPHPHGRRGRRPSKWDTTRCFPRVGRSMLTVRCSLSCPSLLEGQRPRWPAYQQKPERTPRRSRLTRMAAEAVGPPSGIPPGVFLELDVRC